MLTAMTEDDWAIVLQVFRAVRSRRGDKGRDDRKFLEALHYFTVHTTWRALPVEFGHWNSIWKRFWRLSRAGVFEAFFERSQNAARPRIWCRCSTPRWRARTSRPRVQKGATRPGARPLARRLLNQNPPQGRSRRLAARLSSDRRRSQRQPQFRTPRSTSDRTFRRAPRSPTRV